MRARILFVSIFLLAGIANATEPPPSWWVESNKFLATMGYSVAGAGDVNGDDHDDVMVGAPFWTDSTPSSPNRGVVWVCYGSPSGLPSTCEWGVQADRLGENLGFSVSSAGDVNGDGYDDVILGEGQQDTAPDRVYVYYGSETGLQSVGSWSVEEAGSYREFGYSVSSAGDVNDDGYDDVIVGDPDYNPDVLDHDFGRAYVYLGSATGLSTTPDWTADGPHAFARFGWSVSAAGDVNGDGYGDVVVGAPEYFGSDDDVGAVFVFHGSEDGLSAEPDLLLEGARAAEKFGLSVSAAGDVNGDDFSDVVVGANLHNATGFNDGQAYVFLGSESGLATRPAWNVAGEPDAASWFGHSVASAGDVNGDGFSDVVVGAPAYWDGTVLGRAYVYAGSESGPSDAPLLELSLDTDQANAYFGYSVDGAGDVNGDGLSDVICGAIGYADGESNEGAAFVFHGLGIPPAGRIPDGVDPPGRPLTVDKERSGEIVLDWEPSCLDADGDYAIYEGTVGDFGSHAARFCTTGGETEATFLPPPRSAYYLVVPHNGSAEGSYGRDSFGVERPQGFPDCMKQLVGSCE